MDRFYIKQKVANGKSTITIADLIPKGRENAISKRELLNLCVLHDLCKTDREMRRLIEIARIGYVILNNSDGKGYYIPSREDGPDLQRYIRQEEKRARSTFRNITMAKALYEDYKHGRVEVS